MALLRWVSKNDKFPIHRGTWAAELKKPKTGSAWVEIRKTTMSGSVGTAILIFVSLGGGFGKRPAKIDVPWRHKAWEALGKINVQLSMNGPAQLTFEEFQDLYTAVEEAKQVLTLLKEGVNVEVPVG